MEKNDLAMIKAENDRLVNDVEKLKQRLREEITRTQAGVRLDLNLEKGRMREESSGQELKIKEVDTRIEQEIAVLRTAMQASKVSTITMWDNFMHHYDLAGNNLAILSNLRYVHFLYIIHNFLIARSNGKLCSTNGVLEISVMIINHVCVMQAVATQVQTSMQP
jgi:hypothetical protein